MYTDTKKKLDRLRSQHGEVKFRMAVSHLMDVGIRHLSDELVEECCAEIMTEDDSRYFMTNEYKCGLVRLAGELAKFPHTELLVYIQREISYDVGDGLFLPELHERFRDYVAHMEPCSDCEVIYANLKNAGLSNKEIIYIEYGYVIPEDDEDDY